MSQDEHKSSVSLEDVILRMNTTEGIDSKATEDTGIISPEESSFEFAREFGEDLEY